VTFRNSDHVGWNSSKIISRLVSLGCLLCARPQHHESTPKEHPKIFVQNRGRVHKTWMALCCYIFIVSHSICFYAVNDYSECSTSCYLAKSSEAYHKGGAITALAYRNRNQITIKESLDVGNKKAQLSLTNPRDAKACQKLLQFDVLTTLSLTIL